MEALASKEESNGTVSSEEEWELLSNQSSSSSKLLKVEVEGEEDLMLVEEVDVEVQSEVRIGEDEIVHDVVLEEVEDDGVEFGRERDEANMNVNENVCDVNVSNVTSGNEDEPEESFDDCDIPILRHDNNFISGVINGFEYVSRDISRAAMRFSEQHKLQERSQEVAKHIGGTASVVGSHAQHAAKSIGGTACIIGEKAQETVKHIGGAVSVVGEQATIVGQKTHQSLGVAAEKIRDFEEKHHVTDAIASAAVFFGASSFATGHITRGISALGVAVAAHTLGIGMRTSHDQHQQNYSSQSNKDLPY